MTIHKACIRGFRCFDRYDIELDPYYTVIAGPNASGKTSLLEAFHVAARLRSFRTPTITDLIKQGTGAFSVRLFTEQDEIHVAYGNDVHLAEINGSGPASRGKLMQALSITTITEQDLELVQGYPETRRSFLDQTSVMRREPEAEKLLNRYHQIYKKRAALLSDPSRWNRGSYEIITEQMWDLTSKIRTMRQRTIQALEEEIKQLIQYVIPEALCQLEYKVSEKENGIISPEEWCKAKEQDERRVGRSLMGPHLDDMEIMLQHKQARRFLSRGMQKVIAVLLKVAQARPSEEGGRSTLLLDDLLADFDEHKLDGIMKMLVNTNIQIVFTAPMVDQLAKNSKNMFPASASWIHLI